MRFRIDPRHIPPAKAARRLHLSLFDFEAKRPRLHARGFPKPDPDTGNYDLKAIDDWMDRQSGLTGSPPPQQAKETILDRFKRQA